MTVLLYAPLSLSFKNCAKRLEGSNYLKDHARKINKRTIIAKGDIMRKTAVSITVIIACGIFLSGCYTYGQKKITQNETVAQIVEGKSTKADVKALLGEPSNVSFIENEEMWMYFYNRSTTRPATFIPIIGIFAGGVDMKDCNLTIIFTKDGVVKRVGRGSSSGGGGSVFD